MNVEPFKNRVGRLIRSARESAGLGQDELARRIGNTVTKSLISRYETGHVLPRIERLREALKACGIPSIPPAIEAGYREVAQQEVSPYAQVYATEAAKEFIKVWLEHRSIDEVAGLLGMHRDQVAWYAKRLRRKGIKLPRAQRPRQPDRENIEELRDFLRSLLSREEGPKETDDPQS